MTKLFTILLTLSSFFLFNKYVFFPLTYQKFFDLELKSENSVFTDYRSDRLAGIYHKIYYLCRNKKKEVANTKIMLTMNNLHHLSGEYGEGESGKKTHLPNNKGREFSWVTAPLFSSIEILELLFNNGLTSMEMISFFKYKLGVPFNIKDEVNLIWDLFVNKKVYKRTLYKKDFGTYLSLRLNKGNFSEINKKYITLLADLADYEKLYIELHFPEETPRWLLDFSKSVAESSAYFKLSL